MLERMASAGSQILALSLAALAGAGLTWSVLSDSPPSPAEQPPPQLGGNVIAIVDGDPILREDWEARLSDHPGADARRLLAAETRRLAVLAAAREAGLADDPQVRARVEAAMVARYLQDELDTRLDEVRVHDRELETHLQAHPVTPPAPLRRVAVLRKALASNDPGSARAALLEARAAVAGLELPIPHFGPLAQQYSDHRPSQARGGVLGYLGPDHSEHDLVPAPVHAAAWALAAPGAVSDVVETDEALYLVRYVDEHIPRGHDIDSQVARLRERLLMEKRAAARDAFFDRIEAMAGVEIADEWKAEAAPEQRPVPPPGPGTRTVAALEARS